MEFEWDEDKAAGNLEKHGVGFSEAHESFADEKLLVDSDWKHYSVTELRYIAIGKSILGRVLTVVFTRRVAENGKEKVRIISARKANPKEKKDYLGA